MTWDRWLNKTHIGDCRDLLKQMAADGVRVQMCVTSPPYFGLRDYGHAGQIGLEPTPSEYVAQMVAVFRLVRDVLANDGTLWLNLGDSYAGSWGAQGRQGKTGQMANRSVISARQIEAHPKKQSNTVSVAHLEGLKAKDLMGIPWRVALALQADGWYLRSDIIWHKPNPMPESVSDRPTKAHEYIFLLTKSERYYYDAEAIRELASEGTHERRSKYPSGKKPVAGWATGSGSHTAVEHAKPKAGARKLADAGFGIKNNSSFDAAMSVMPEWRNKRTVWTVPTYPFKGAHFATFPPDLIKPCILAGSRHGDVVLDPFMGSGTTAQVSTDLGRQFIGCELNPKYVELHDLRRTTIGMAI